MSVRRGQLAVVSLFFFVYVALEIGFANWIHSYVEQIGYGDANTATGVTVIFWVGFSLGRVSSIWLAGRFSAGWMLVGSMRRGPGVVDGARHRQRRQHRFVDRDVPVRRVDRSAVRVDDRLRRGPPRAVGRSDIGIHRRRRTRWAGHAVDCSVSCSMLEGPEVLPPVTLVACLATVAVGLWVRHMVQVTGDQRPPVTSMNAPVT